MQRAGKEEEKGHCSLQIVKDFPRPVHTVLLRRRFTQLTGAFVRERRQLCVCVCVCVRALARLVRVCPFGTVR